MWIFSTPPGPRTKSIDKIDVLVNSWKGNQKYGSKQQHSKQIDKIQEMKNSSIIKTSKGSHSQARNSEIEYKWREISKVRTQF